MNLRTIEERLRREHGLSADFSFWCWGSFPLSGPTIYVEFTGGNCPRITRGPRKGRPNYRKPTDIQAFAVTIDKAEQWESEYETATGKCRVCRGSGRKYRGLTSVTNTTDYRECSQCRGSGKCVEIAVFELGRSETGV